MADEKKGSGAIAWFTFVVSVLTLCVAAFVAIEDRSAKRETNGVARAAVIKDVIPALTTDEKPRGKKLAFEALLSSLPTSSTEQTKGSKRGQSPDASEIRDSASLDTFLVQLYVSEPDHDVACYYGSRLRERKVIVGDSAGVLCQPASAASAPSRPQIAGLGPVEKRSGQMPSGQGKSFSAPYELCSDPLPNPEKTVISSSEFFLVGDRACGAWATCEQSTKQPDRVCWRFSMQGHDERPFNSVSTSEGVLRYQVTQK